MQYLRIYLTKSVRRMIMIGWIATFFIVAPIIIFYTAGYRYDFTTHRIKQTGIISIDVLPKNTAVVLNDVLLDKKLPLRLTNRAPGVYNISLLKEGYKTWNKTIRVDSNQTTYIRDIQLLRDTLPYPFFDENQYTVYRLYSPVVKNHLLFSTESEGIFELYSLDITSSHASLLLRQAYASDPIVSWSPTENFFSVDMTDLGGKLFVFDKEEKRSSVPAPLTSLPLWHAHRGLVASDSESLFSLHPVRGIERLSYTQNSSAWFLDESQLLWEYDVVTKRLQTTNTQQSIVSTVEIPIDTTITQIIDVNSARALFQTIEGIAVFSFSTQQVTMLPGATKTYFHQNKKEWLVWSEHELWSIFADGTILLVERTSDVLRNVMQLDTYGVLLIQKDNALEAYNPGYQVRQSLLANGSVESVSVDTTNRTIYMIATIAGKRDMYVLEY